MTEWTIRKWARHGHDRLYAATPGGTDLGFLDVATGRYHSDDLSNLPLLRAAIADHLDAQRQSGNAFAAATSTLAAIERAPALDPGTGLAVPAMAAASVPPGSTWHDLAGVRAGAAARERALAERKAQGTIRHVVARVLGSKTDERAWRIGADGEEAVAGHLDALGTQWRVLHSVRVGERGADIDHVVIGPGGVFTVNAKHHPRASIWVGGDTFMVNGRRVPYIRNGRHEAKRASRLLAQHAGFPVPATALIAVVGAHRGFAIKGQPADGAVAVVSCQHIRKFFQSQPQRLSLREIDAIHEVARRSTTWHR